MKKHYLHSTTAHLSASTFSTAAFTTSHTESTLSVDEDDLDKSTLLVDRVDWVGRYLPVYIVCVTSSLLQLTAITTSPDLFTTSWQIQYLKKLCKTSLYLLLLHLHLPRHHYHYNYEYFFYIFAERASSKTLFWVRPGSLCKLLWIWSSITTPFICAG